MNTIPELAPFSTDALLQEVFSRVMYRQTSKPLEKVDQDRVAQIAQIVREVLSKEGILYEPFETNPTRSSQPNSPNSSRRAGITV